MTETQPEEIMDNHGEQVARPEPPPAHYEFDIDLDSDTTHARIVRLIGTDRRVLELGPATGYMSDVLRRRGCSVVGNRDRPRDGQLRPLSTASA